mgnify:CR=1 FL=1
MAMIEQLFDRLDDWRHLPNYQLERRADIFFSLYLAEALEKKFGEDINHILVPEFPVRYGSVYEDSVSNQSFKVDYLVLNREGSQAYFVELKTDADSKGKKQQDHMEDAANKGLRELLAGLLPVFEATHAKDKYRHLFLLLEKLGLIETMATRPPFKVICGEIPIRIVYLQPETEDEDSIGFSEFASVVESHEDEVSKRFARSLRTWTSRAGLEGVL